jgi:hypothetical protein
MFAIPDGLPPPVAVTYCGPAVAGASTGPESVTVGVLLSIWTVLLMLAETPAASLAARVSDRGP